VQIPETKYAKTADGLHIAYQVLGTGPTDLVLIPTYAGHVELTWEEPHQASYLRQLASFTRLILFDKRGTGLSDRMGRAPSLDERTDDVLAVLDAVDSLRTVIMGDGDAGCLAAYFGASHPDRTLGLILFDTLPRIAWAPDNPSGVTESQHLADLDAIERGWGTEAFARPMVEENIPSLSGGPFVGWLAKVHRYSASPGDALAFEQLWYETDVRSVLSTIHVPTLVITVPSHPDEMRAVARQIHGAKQIELKSDQPWFVDPAEMSDIITDFVASLRREEAEFDRVLATVLFTDIVGSTSKVAELGDHDWRELVERHHAATRALLSRYRGTEMDTAGDGFFATFDGPARAVRCAQAIVEAVEFLDIEVRVGLHTGEVLAMDDKLGGIAVTIGARVGALAGPSEILVSQTVKDLVAGSGLVFEDAGEHELKGVPDRWHLYRVVG
jgi:class 3 adenylate cyclase